MKHHPERNVAEAARSWTEHWEYRSRLLSRWGGPQIMVKYEALCARPEQVTAQILVAAGLDPEHMSLQFRDYEQHIMGNPMRLQDGSTIVDKQEWRQSLTAGQLKIFETIAGGRNRALGYT